jgi:hypothetical protein
MVLTIAYNIQNHWGLLTLPIGRNSKYLESTTFRKLDLFLSSGDESETPAPLGPLEFATLNHWTKTKTDPVSETL